MTANAAARVSPHPNLKPSATVRFTGHASQGRWPGVYWREKSAEAEGKKRGYSSCAPGHRAMRPAVISDPSVIAREASKAAALRTMPERDTLRPGVPWHRIF